MRASLWAWILQRITAVALLLLIAVHFSVMHFVDPTMTVDFASTTVRLKGVLYFAVDFSLLVLGLFHGLNGIRNIIVDYWPRANRAAGVALGLIGLLFAGYGSAALYVFLNIR